MKELTRKEYLEKFLQQHLQECMQCSYDMPNDVHEYCNIARQLIEEIQKEGT